MAGGAGEGGGGGGGEREEKSWGALLLYKSLLDKEIFITIILGLFAMLIPCSVEEGV